MNLPASGADVTFGQLIDRYAAVLLDAYGVLVDGRGAITGAKEMIAALEAARKPYFVVTNDASRLPATAARRFQNLGLPIPEERIITSGSLLSPYYREHDLSGAPTIVLGPADAQAYVREAGGVVIAPDAAHEARVVVIGDESGYPFLETVDAVLSLIFQKVARGEAMHLLLPNPDLVYPKSAGSYGIAAGSIALMFEAALELRRAEGPVPRFVRLGKPHAPIFAEAVRRAGTRDLVMVGDQLETDVRGALAFGLSAALVETGVIGARGVDLAALPDAIRPTHRLRPLVS